MTIILKYIFFILIGLNLKAQDIPNEFWRSKYLDLAFDSGNFWSLNTSLGIPRYYNYPNLNMDNKIMDSDSLYIDTRFGLYSRGENISLYGFGHFLYKNGLYGYLYPRIVNNPDGFIRYSGIPRNISRGGFNSGETDLSGIGFQNNWLTFQIGRGRESWAAGNDIELVLSPDSPAYDYGMIGSNYGSLNVKYFHGFLESNDEKISRYILGKGIEWSNSKSFLMSISEIIIYSGYNRPLDIAYLNPISSHLEIELNDRLNVVGSQGANAIWQFSLDWLIRNKSRLSLNILFDEFVLDKEEKDLGKEHGKAYSMKITYPLVKTTFNKSVIAYFSLIKVGTPTFRHSSGYNNFVTRNKPLGWSGGSDGDDISIGINLFYKDNFISKFKLSRIRIGNETIINRNYDSYHDYLYGTFPSGNVEKVSLLTNESQFWFKENLSSNLEIKIHEKNNILFFAWAFGINIFLKNEFSI